MSAFLLPQGTDREPLEGRPGKRPAEGLKGQGESYVRRPMSTPQGLKATKASVQGGVIGHFLDPATPQDSHPSSTEDADRVRMVGAALPRPPVDVLRPGMPLAGGVGQGPHSSPQS